MPEFFGRDGVRLVFHELGQGRPVVLLHGYFSTAYETWVRTGHAAKIAARGHRVIMPDLRGHGSSATPHDPEAYPHDVLADDGLALIDALGLTDYDLGGYSIGGRMTVRMLVRGATPRRAVVAGQSLRSVTAAAGRGPGGRLRTGGFFQRVLTGLGTFSPGSPEWKAEEFLHKVGGDPVALLRVSDTYIDTPLEEVSRIAVPTLVVTGDADNRASAEELAATLRNARYVAVPGDHASAVESPLLGTAIADFLSEQA